MENENIFKYADFIERFMLDEKSYLCLTGFTKNDGDKKTAVIEVVFDSVSMLYQWKTTESQEWRYGCNFKDIYEATKKYNVDSKQLENKLFQLIMQNCIGANSIVIETIRLVGVDVVEAAIIENEIFLEHLQKAISTLMQSDSPKKEPEEKKTNVLKFPGKKK